MERSRAKIWGKRFIWGTQDQAFLDGSKRPNWLTIDSTSIVPIINLWTGKPLVMSHNMKDTDPRVLPAYNNDDIMKLMWYCCMKSNKANKWFAFERSNLCYSRGRTVPVTIEDGSMSESQSRETKENKPPSPQPHKKYAKNALAKRHLNLSRFGDSESDVQGKLMTEDFRLG